MTLRSTPPLGWKTASPEPISSGKLNRSRSAPEATVVAPRRLLEPLQVGVERLLALPGGAVDALQLRVLLVAAPVRRRGAHQLEGRDALGGRQVRTAAEVLPGRDPSRRRLS